MQITNFFQVLFRKHGALFLFLFGLTVAQSCPADLVEAIARAKPSIVIVGTHSKTGSPPLDLRGTGFVVGNGNLVATNAHVINSVRETVESKAERSLVVQVRTAKGESQLRSASVLRSDAPHDLALLRIDGPPLPALVIADSDNVREGESVAFIGFPIGGALGFSPVTHRGIISAITSIAPPSPNARVLNERAIRSVMAGAFQIFQLDATAYPGNSGGPLIYPASGEVVGIVNMVFVKGAKETALTQPSGISYAIPSKYLAELIKSAPN